MAPQGLMRYRRVILDRDGLLNYEAPGSGYILDPEDYRWPPGVTRGARAAAGEPWPPVPSERDWLVSTENCRFTAPDV